MNDFLDLSSRVMLSLPGFRLYALCAVVLAVKMYAVAFYTAVTRLRAKVSVNPEDAVQFGAQVSTADHPEVERLMRAHRNDLENIPLFLILGLIAVLVGAPPLGLRICFIVFTAARVAYTLAYLKAMQPWRSMVFGLGMVSAVALVVMIIVRLVS
jgi:prostaglandin-E synthase 1